MKKLILVIMALLAASNCAGASVKIHRKVSDGEVPVVRLSPASLTFASQTVETTSAARAVTLTNTGTVPLTLSSISATGNYAQTNTCGASLAVGASCVISVTFTPTASGTQTGGITLADNAASSPQAISLTGTAVAVPPQAAVVSLSPASLTFASQTVETTSAARAVTLTNTGTVPLTLSSISATGNYAQTNTCGASLAVGASCVISVTFTPTASGTQTGGITLADNAASSPQAISLTGTAVAVPAQSAAAPSQSAGYSLVWEDTFSTLSLCTTNVSGCNWYNPGLWWETPAGTVSDPSGTNVNLQWASGQANNTNIATASPNGEYYRSWTYGYFEVSMAFDPVTGSAPAIWLVPVSEIQANTASNGIPYGELDMFEWQSNNPTLFCGTVHVYVNQVDTANNASNDCWTVPAGTNFSNYNTYGVLWTPTSISWYFNNVLMETVSTTSSSYNSVFGGSESYFLVLSQQASCNWTVPCSGQVSPTNMDVQWVHIYAP